MSEIGKCQETRIIPSFFGLGSSLMLLILASVLRFSMICTNHQLRKCVCLLQSFSSISVRLGGSLGSEFAIDLFEYRSAKGVVDLYMC